ncbi:hypothetical protein HOP62_02530 [Halomonas sp. MCCC 1A17488]|uniref:hypothetical protein n=1 Tax=unclassified Halomonas TaxID=2609666 RepID=UPI0018D2023E|nr:MULTISPECIES: hypothetical protein [unclassified Halomonas]MCE8014950.1 hypothetical protein [Halomonas sp. MCCC 1A17488]MCG3238283.1 hypothetical protein [Halomonas sp. MCCC 1A17488]QPP47960.1 hypothetical protein I4484_11870 [Halomonas sp. SS10-MC5]
MSCFGAEIYESKGWAGQAGVRFLLNQDGSRMQESALKVQDISYLLLYAKALCTWHVMAWEEALPPQWRLGSIVH